MRTVVILCLAASALPGVAGAQVPAPADSTGRDTSRVTTLPEIEVSVTRTAEPLARVPYAVGVLNRTDIQRGQQTVGLDEALNDIPGVVVSNRYNFSLDQRISIRGFGSRANFGVRGVKVLLDGIPQTLPDGQSQLTNVDFADLGRAEVLRGSSSSLYGNAAGGVVALQTEPPAQAPFAQRVRAQAGGGERDGDGFYKVQSWTSGRLGSASGTLSISRFKADGFRQHSAADIRQLNAGLDYVFSGTTLGTLRFSAADNPQAQNPGALTLTEYRANADSAAANNILREADKDVNQQQLALGLRHFDAAGNEYNVTAFGLLRDLLNPLAAPPPGEAAFNPTVGTFVDIGRVVGGARASTTQRLGAAPTAPRLSAGADIQRMRDNRKNNRAVSGVPTDSLVLDQTEKITEFGPFAQVQWSPREELLLNGGLRYDWVKFDVADHFLGDGVDNSGDRTNSALSGHVGASWSFGDRFVPYVNVSTSFETPTTTELVNQPNSTGGFNTELKPQRAVNYEVGARGQPTPRVTYSVALFLGRIKDAIVQQEEIGGRAFFVNAGKTHNDGAEVGLTVTPIDALTLSAAYTYSHFRFAQYTDESGNSLDGNKLPGVPDHFWRLGLRAALPRDFWADVDHTLSSSMATDDANTLFADSWGAGVTNLRFGWSGDVGEWNLAPFVGINNLWDRRYIGSVTINGTFGRVFEPAPRRVVYVGAEIGYRTGS